MSSEVGICNSALQKIGAEAIASLTEDSPNGRRCNRVYADIRDAELRAHPWSFAKTRAEVAALSAAPDFEYDSAFQLPTDCLRLIRVADNNTVAVTDYTIEGRTILTNAAAPLRLVYIRRETDPAQFDPLFDQALAWRIAVELVEVVTQSNTKRQWAEAGYEAAIREARKANAFERLSAEMPTDPWITARL